MQWEANNRDELMVFTDRQQCYKLWLFDCPDGKASLLGEYLPSELAMEPGENILWACLPGDYSGDLFFFFENGKVARIPLKNIRPSPAGKSSPVRTATKAP